MLADVSDLELHDLSIPAAAMTEIRAAERCALCAAPPLARDASATATFEWLAAFDPAQASAMRSNAPGIATRWEDVRSRAVIDSQLRPVVPIPVSLLDVVIPRLDADLVDFVPSAFACAVCDRCAAGTSFSDAAATLRAAYVALHFDGNASAAAAQPSWPLAQRFLEIVSVAAGREEREA